MAEEFRFDRGWSRTKIGDLLERHQEQVKGAELNTFDRYVGVDHLDSGDLVLRRSNEMSDGTLPPTFRFAFRKGMFLFPTRRPKLNKYAIAPFDGITGEKILILKPKVSGATDAEFLSYLLGASAIRSWVIEKAIGSITPHFRWRDLAELEIWIPPLDRQIAIAKRLASAYEAREALLDAKAKLIETRDSLVNTLIFKSGFSDVPFDALAEINPTIRNVSESDLFIAMDNLEAWNRDIPIDKLGKKGSRGGVRAGGGDVLMARITPCLENGKIAIVPESIEKCGASTEWSCPCKSGHADTVKLMMQRFAGTPGGNGTSVPYAGGVRCNAQRRQPDVRALLAHQAYA